MTADAATSFELVGGWPSVLARLFHREDLTTHYVRTLRCWRENFIAQLERVRLLGYDGRFQRVWELYLAYCEGGFGGGRIGKVEVDFFSGPKPTGTYHAPSVGLR